MQDDPKKQTKKLKRGRLTAEELKFLKEKGASMSVEDIALSLNRSETTIAKWLSKNKIKNEAYYEHDPERSKIRAELVAEPFFAQLEKQLTEPEQRYFVSQYCEHILQMSKLASVQYTEKMQIMHLIRNEIMIDRILCRQKHAHQESEKLQLQLKAVDLTTDRMIAKQIQTQIEGYNHQFSSFGRELKELQDKVNQLRRELKATRQQHVENLKELAKDFEKIVSNLQDNEFRNREGKEINVFRAAMEVEKKRLQTWHVFSDEAEDIPLLTPELVDQMQENQEDEQ
jgi:hypothetical protein